MGRRPDDDEFTALVHGISRSLYRTAYLLCGDPHRAQDLVQTALLKAYRRWRWVARASAGGGCGVNTYGLGPASLHSLWKGRRPRTRSAA